uniref:Uncharacterized protein n=1 Tax=Arundo donax TaxID=35708 RepID=A0A0A9B8T1_ARUDO
MCETLEFSISRA